MVCFNCCEKKRKENWIWTNDDEEKYVSAIELEKLHQTSTRKGVTGYLEGLTSK